MNILSVVTPPYIYQMFSFPFVCCEYMNVQLLKRVHPSKRAAAFCYSSFTVSKDALCIQLSELELYLKDKMCKPCISYRMVMYIDITDTRYPNRFIVSLPCHSDGILHFHDNLLLLQLPIKYSQASDHSVTVALKKTVLLIGTPLEDTHWRNLIHVWRPW